MERGGTVYIMTNKRNTALYVGVTSDLYTRLIKHRTRLNPRSFTFRYNIEKLVYFENFHSIEEAIAREKQIKKYRREKKLALIIHLNPQWRDLFDEVAGW